MIIIIITLFPIQNNSMWDFSATSFTSLYRYSYPTFCYGSSLGDIEKVPHRLPGAVPDVWAHSDIWFLIYTTVPLSYPSTYCRPLNRKQHCCGDCGVDCGHPLRCTSDDHWYVPIHLKCIVSTQWGIYYKHLSFHLHVHLLPACLPCMQIQK
jgi:hypothetical protein